jgi:hypothetical protein
MSDLDQKILENALSPKKATGDSGSVESHNLTDQIAADRYLASKRAMNSQSKGFHQSKFVPPGAA